MLISDLKAMINNAKQMVGNIYNSLNGWHVPIRYHKYLIQIWKAAVIKYISYLSTKTFLQ